MRITSTAPAIDSAPSMIVTSESALRGADKPEAYGVDEPPEENAVERPGDRSVHLLDQLIEARGGFGSELALTVTARLQHPHVVLTVAQRLHGASRS